MKPILIIFLFIIGYIGGIHAQESPKHEVRAAWVTAVYGLDWPRTRATSPATMRRQQAELTEILDRLKEANFNTVLFQARTRGDVLYRSDIEPWNKTLTGRTDGHPGYDPLAFAIEECHKRGMECHAWMVAIPLGNRKHVASLGKESVTKRKKNITVAYKREYFLNPGHPETKEYLWSLVREIVERYDIDGIHLDYLRYPEYAKNRFPDRYDFRRRAKGRTLAQWRRDNLTEIVRRLHRGIKSIKPWVKFSTSPVGKYDDTSRYSSRGWNAYHAVHQDVQGWLAEELQDQIYPMQYFRGNNFYPFALDWQEQSNGRHIVSGLGTYFLHPQEGDWPLEELERQLHFVRRQGLAGQGHYRVKYLMDDVKGVMTLLEEEFYPTPALVPPMPWIDDERPTAPTHLMMSDEQSADSTQPSTPNCVRLTWNAAIDNDLRNAPTYIIYASDTAPVDTSNPANIIAQGVRDTTYLYAPQRPWERRKYFAVTAMDRCGNESEAAFFTSHF